MLNERELTKKELEKREEFIKDLKSNKRGFVKRYGKDAEKVMYAIATKRAKKTNEEMNKDKIKEMIKSSLQGPVSEKKGKDMDGDGDIDSKDYLAARDAAIKKAKKQDLKEFGSSDMSVLLGSMHRDLGTPKEFPGLSKIMDAAEDATDFYMDDFEEYSTDRDELVMSNARAYARRYFPEFMEMAAKMLEPIDEMDINDPVAMKMRAAKDKLAKMKAANAGDDGNDKFFAKNAARLGKLKALKDKRAQIMRDMEQEAEMEGGPIADKYGDMLNKLDKAIAMLSEDNLNEGFYGSSDVESITNALGYADVYDFFEDNPGAVSAILDWAENVPEFKDMLKDADLLQERKKIVTEDKMEALMELRNILDELQVLGDQAKDIIAQNFPSFLSKGEAYGAFDMGSSSNRYDTTLASIVADIEEYGDEEDEDMMQEDLDLGHQDNEPHMLKGDLYRIGKYAMELYQMVDGFEGKGEVDFPHWWQSKVVKAKDMMVSAKHYLDFETKEPEIDAMVGVADQEDVIDENYAIMMAAQKAMAAKAKKDKEKKEIKEEDPGKADMVASAIQKAMNKHKGDESKTYQLQQARKAMNKGDLDKAEKIAKRLAEKLKSK